MLCTRAPKSPAPSCTPGVFLDLVACAPSMRHPMMPSYLPLTTCSPFIEEVPVLPLRLGVRSSVRCSRALLSPGPMMMRMARKWRAFVFPAAGLATCGLLASTHLPVCCGRSSFSSPFLGGPDPSVYLVEKVLARPPVMEQLLFGCPGADDAGAFWPADTRPARERRFVVFPPLSPPSVHPLF